MNSLLLPILYAPYRYTHPEYHRLYGLDLARLPESVANKWLIEHWALPTALEFDFDKDPEIATCVQSWAHLRRICFLIGALRLRSAIIEQAWYPKLDRLARQFLVIPAPVVPAARASAQLQATDIYAAGSAGLATVFRRMPDALRCRLPLLFPLGVASRLAAQLKTREDDFAFPPFVFSLAHRYAVDPNSPVS
ncbi:type III secretion apparatus protein OrgA/MxiK [Burkholderia latens]|uniref:type III secretion apparatus protein OrgA/MxiK n=1 Tax=Burkholderia latens TaxID=488446 RepID=UPI00158AAC1B|nr:type III secretion apparatus protein OrgA/MxiK [Burkholderia latens]